MSDYVCDSIFAIPFAEKAEYSLTASSFSEFKLQEKSSRKSEKYSPKLASILIKSLLYEGCKARDLLPLELRFSQRSPNLPTYTLSAIIFGEL